MASSGEDTSDEMFNFKCTACAKRNGNKKAVKYCVECQGYCCQACVDTHEVFPTLVTHTLLDRASFKSEFTTDLPEIPTQRCTIHETNLMNMYCENHDVVGCTTCIALEHRVCTDVRSIQDEIGKLFRQSDFEKVCQNLREKKSGIEKSKEANIALLDELNKSKDEAVKSIKDFRKDLELCLEKMELESIKIVEEEFHRAESILKNQMDKLENEVGRLEKAANDVEKSEGNKAQQFVSIKAAQKLVAEAEADFNTVDSVVEAKMVFVINQNIRDSLKQQLTFGSVFPVTSKQKRTTIYTIKGMREMDIRTQNDTHQGDIHGSCITEDGLLLLADCDNKKLKVVDIVKMSVVDQCNLLGNPFSVCCAKPHEAVVSFNNNTIQFISLSNPISPMNQIKLGHSCSGLCSYKDRLYITDKCISLYIHDMAGTLLQTVSKDNSGNDLFANCQKIAISDTGDKIFVTDSKKGVVTVDTQGKHIETFSDTGVTNALAVCTDYKGNLFVCGNASNNVVQLTQNGKEKLGVVVQKSDGVQNSLSISFDPRRCTLIVTQCGNDKVKFFDLQ
ncbi:uncharacterized protein LOC123535147 [Mercenaria mercenaria]|uniref:uncharacterized protein LOC123535147 n=1 Tax=Mercenaria mercenaria TaxID=6596 RepID=UPI001E1DFA37|nr:uncharacterized protein LOC123535147 [Mercenaria mercenaria]